MSIGSDTRQVSLRDRVRDQLRRARASGDLQPTATEALEIEDDGVVFHVRVIAGPDRKWSSRAEQEKTGEDPFLPPYSDDLFVADLSETHVALLNKFPVLDSHLLIVTREDEPQQSWLTRADFEALACCLRELDGLAFYNGGRTAGSSQPHKHLQLVPMPVTTTSLFDPAVGGFACAVVDLSGDASAAELHAAYGEAMARVAVDADREPYNVLIDAERLVAIPRTRHAIDGVFLNAMGYAGSFLVRSREHLEKLRALGPRRVLREAGRAG